MKILHVINSIDPSWGGTVACVRQVGAAMLRRGHLVEVASLSDSDAAASFPVKSTTLGPSVLKYSFSPKAIKWLLGNVGRYDIVVINGLWQFQGLVTAVAAWAHKKPYVVYVHGMLGPLGRNSWRKFGKKLLYWSLVEYWVVRGARFVIFTSAEEAALARDFFPFFTWREAVVANGVESAPPLPAGSVSRLLTRFPQLENKIIVLSLGRIVQGKGLEILLEAFLRVFENDPRYHLAIVGPDQDPEYTESLKEQVRGKESCITWTGLLLGENREAAFAIASVFVSPSHHENFGMAVVEALCRGVPVIATNKVNIHSLLSSAQAAIVCEDSVDGISDALRHWALLSDEALRLLRQRQLDAFKQLFSIENTAETFESVLNEALEARP